MSSLALIISQSGHRSNQHFCASPGRNETMDTPQPSDIETLALTRYRVLDIPHDQVGDLDRLLDDFELIGNQKQIGGNPEWQERGRKLAGWNK